MLRYGYITNGLVDHSLEQSIQLLKHFGYQGIGITMDHHPLDPFQATRSRLREIRARLEAAGLQPVIETGARYYLDAYRKHRPSLVSVDADGRRKRVAYYERTVDVAALLGATVVSLWSGVAQPGTPAEVCWGRLEDVLPPLLDRAQDKGVAIGFEPEPGMFVERLDDFRELKRRIDHPALRLTVDIGHLECSEERPLDQQLDAVMDDVVNVHVDDIKDQKHEHLPLGQGEIDFRPLLGVLKRHEYSGVVLVELARNSHEAPIQAQRSIIFLRNAESQ